MDDDEPKNILCCHFFLKSVFFFKESVVIFISTLSGIGYFLVSFSMIFYILPINMLNTYQTQIQNLDVYLNVALWLLNFNNLIMSLHLLTLTQKQKKCWNFVCKFGKSAEKKSGIETSQIYKTQKERYEELIEKEKQGFWSQVAEKLNKPSKNYLLFLMLLNVNQVMSFMSVSYLYGEPVSGNVYFIYQEQSTRQIIDIIMKITMVQGVMGLLSCATMLLVGFLSVIENCIVQSCLPEFKGTYDEDQDALLAVDWEIGDERLRKAEEIDIEMSWYSESGQNSSGSGSDEGANTYRRQLRERRNQLREHSEEYNKRLSELKLFFCVGNS